MKTEIHFLVEEALVEDRAVESTHQKRYYRPFKSSAIDDINNSSEKVKTLNQELKTIGLVVISKSLDEDVLPFEGTLVYLNKTELSKWLIDGLAKPLLKNVSFKNHDVSVYGLFNHSDVDTSSANNRIDLLEHVREAFPDQSDVLNQYFPDLKVCKRDKTSL